MRILVICSGNICRSPMVAEYLRHRASQEGLSHLVVESAGTLGITGSPASCEAIQVFDEHGLDLSRHRSQALTDVLVSGSDVIVGMAREHRAYLDEAHPDFPGECWLLRSFENGATPRAAAPDLADPIGCDLETYRSQFPLIRRCVDHLLIYLMRAGPGVGHA
jgi:protein-tyrosine-phosphatase